MKKILLIVVFLCTSVTIFAQDQPFRFGLHIDPSVNWYSSNVDGVDGGSRIAFAYGLIADYYFAERYAITTGVKHNITGGKVSIVEAETIYKIQYLEIPLGLKLKTNQMGNLTYLGNIGLNSGVRLSAKKDVDGQGINQEGVSAKDDIGFLNLSLQILLGAEYDLDGSSALLAGLYFHNGLNNIAKDYKGDNKLTSSNIGIRLGVMF